MTVVKVPTWPSSYLVEARFEMQPVGFNKIVFENLTIYYDSMYGGLQSYENGLQLVIQSFAANATFEIMAAQTQFMCQITPANPGPAVASKHVHAAMLGASQSSITIQPGLPSMTNFTYMGEMFCPGKKGSVCLHFQMVVPASSGKTSNYEMYVDKETNTPYRYEWVGYDMFLSSHFDHYIVTYTKYVPNFSNPALLAVPALCQNNTNTAAPSEAYENGQSGAHHMHKAMPSEAHAGFRAFAVEHGKQYKHQQEYNSRLLQFTKNMDFVNTHNAKTDKTFKVKLNHHADLTLAEMKVRMGLLGAPDLTGAKVTHKADPKAQMPASIDWRMSNVVSPVKDQGVCGSCWAFSASEAIEGQYAMKNNEIIILSEQFLVDCAWNNGSQGCGGGFQSAAFQYVVEAGGIPNAVDYGSYKMINEMCHYNNMSASASITGFNAITSGDEMALAQTSAVAGPISISINVQLSLVFYESGVYYDPLCQNGIDTLDHAVLLIGYGTDMGSDYWLVKNSWSTFWGDFGYVKMARNRNNACGVATASLYPIIA
jgi:cathepsin L